MEEMYKDALITFVVVIVALFAYGFISKYLPSDL